LYSSPNIIRIIKSRRMRFGIRNYFSTWWWTGWVGCLSEVAFRREFLLLLLRHDRDLTRSVSLEPVGIPVWNNPTEIWESFLCNSCFVVAKPWKRSGI
jgi:hypothetical protein